MGYWRERRKEGRIQEAEPQHKPGVINYWGLFIQLAPEMPSISYNFVNKTMLESTWEMNLECESDSFGRVFLGLADTTEEVRRPDRVVPNHNIASLGRTI